MPRQRASWDWLGEPLAIDFANTMLRRAMEYEDLLASPEDVVEWARREAPRVPGLQRADVDGRLGELRAVRDDVFALLAATADGARLPAAAAERINARVARHPIVRQLATSPGTAVATARGTDDPVDALLAHVADATVALIADPSSGLGLCDAPSCGQFFVRARANQRWCGPACGNRARVARHARR